MEGGTTPYEICTPLSPSRLSKPIDSLRVHGVRAVRARYPNVKSVEQKLAEAQQVVVCVIDFRQGIFGAMDWGSGSDVPASA